MEFLKEVDAIVADLGETVRATVYYTLYETTFRAQIWRIQREIGR